MVTPPDPPRVAPEAARRSVARRLVRWLLLVAAVLAVAAAASLYHVQRRLTSPYKGFAEPEVVVEVPPGSSVVSIGRALAAAGVVPDVTTFRIAAWRMNASRFLQAGEYAFHEATSPEQVVARLARGDVVLRAITFPEGLTLREMAALYESKQFGKAGDFLEAARDVSVIADLDPAARDLEGYLFPETYRLPRRATARDLVPVMVLRFRQVHAELLAKRDPSRSAKPLRELMTLASLVEKETAVADERPIIAAVYANRLRIGMPMQCDPTVIYALTSLGQWSGNLTRSNLQVDSPYNTYRYPGLPPGPIANPGRGAIAAVLAPADVDYLYFVSRNDGSHEFATTLAEHNRNVQRFQVQYFRDKRVHERDDGASRGR